MFRSHQTRESVAAMLEGPMRAADAGNINTDQADDARAIIAELDRLDRITAAQQADNRRKGALQEKARNEVSMLVTIAAPGSSCRRTIWADYHRANCSRKATQTIKDKGSYCTQHSQKAQADLVRALYDKWEAEREEATEDEAIILEGQRVNAERIDALYGRMRRG